ncbi:unnamed protein product, partial [Ixodes hexagonus]
KHRGDQLNLTTFNWKTNFPFSNDKGSHDLENSDKPFTIGSIEVSKPNGNQKEAPPMSFGGSDERSLQRRMNSRGKASRTIAKTPQHSEFSADNSEREDAGPKHASPVGRLDRSRKKLWERAPAPAAPPSRRLEQHTAAARSAHQPEAQADKQPASSTAGSCCDPSPRDGFWLCQQSHSGKVKGLVQTYEDPRRKPSVPSLERR